MTSVSSKGSDNPDTKTFTAHTHSMDVDKDSDPNLDFLPCWIHRGSYMNAHVLLNLLNKLGKRDKMQGLRSILSLFCNEFNKFNNTGAWMLDSIDVIKIT